MENHGVSVMVKALTKYYRAKSRSRDIGGNQEPIVPVKASVLNAKTDCVQAKCQECRVDDEEENCNTDQWRKHLFRSLITLILRPRLS